ncbi:MAG: bifunctional riboflavin kinase/FAD synthetase [Cytophagaceae bacterium]|jgi:riboflavin kinase/FMN adenylyltransferase|nr:bifunctional riboflavin kinase/FAD synthetase [Cytophagaceae bacterium]
MEIYHGLEELNKQACVVTIGTFDGVHLAHQKIIRRVIAESQRLGIHAAVLTFWPHPRKVIAGELPVPALLTSLSEKCESLEALGLDRIIITPFTREFSELDPLTFISEILVNTLQTKKIIIGYDHRFGKDRKGNYDLLKQESNRMGFEVEEITQQSLDEFAISSTQIRTYLNAGEVHQASLLLGRPYSLKGLVVKGKQIGRTLGFPTANIQPEAPDKLIPADGVYAVTVNHDHRYYAGMMNIGNRPTVDGTNKTIEVHLLNFDKDIYGESLQINFIQRIRDQRKFSGLEELKSQLILDKVQTLDLIKIQ